MEPDNQSNQSRERSIPITTTQGNMTTTHFPLTSSSSYSGASSPFNSARNDIFNQFHQFRKNQHPDEMFSDSTFSSLNHPPMNLASRHGDFFSHGHRDETDDGQESHQPRIFNIPIQIETAEGVVPLSRTNSHSPSSSQYRNQSYHASPTPGGGPIGSASSSPVPERVGEQSRQRPGPSPTPPPKPKFIPSFKPEAQSYAQPQHSQFHRVHTIPVKLEKNCKPSEPMSYSPNHNEEVRQTVPVHDQKASAEARFGRDSPDSQQSGGPHVVNIPINLESSQSGESKSKISDRAGSGQSKPVGDFTKESFDSLDLVRNVEKETCRLEKEVMEFAGEGQDKNYRFLDEMLTRCMLKLDNIDSHGREDVRSARKSALAHVDRVIAILESKVSKSQTVESQIETLADKIETECNMQQLSDAASSMDSEPEETHKQGVSEISESVTGQDNEPDEMEIESGTSQSKKISDEQIDTQDEETNDEAIEEDPAGDDGLKQQKRSSLKKWIKRNLQRSRPK
ncbi:BAG domain-containing protein Samui isoform X2 [Tetranychus urticae]|uniref:BAG domain-containing protein n=1 Tax=Tetranychus urticae TaxID=32264 RepID=T1KFW1_TETUR|nr:BAG domain-containing protein Samui isoform X2 [Tetranychus urticae]